MPVTRWGFAAAAFCAVSVIPAVGWSQDAVSLLDEPAYLAPKITQSLILGGASTPGRIVLVGEHGHVLVSDNHGDSWSQAETPTRSMLVDVYFADDQHGWIVGHDAVILRTTDGGQSWEKTHFDPQMQQPLFSVWFADTKRGIAVGAYGLYLETNDGGVSWRRRVFLSEPFGGPENADPDEFIDPEFGEDYHLNHIVRSDDGRLYMAAEAGHFYRSDDQGQTWLSMRTPYAGSYYKTLPLGGDALLLIGMRGNVFYTADAGVNWRKVPVGTQALLSEAVRLSDGQIVLGGMAGMLLVGRDVESLKLHQQANRKGIGVVLPLADDGLILAGEAGVTKQTPAEYLTGN